MLNLSEQPLDQTVTTPVSAGAKAPPRPYSEPPEAEVWPREHRDGAPLEGNKVERVIASPTPASSRIRPGGLIGYSAAMQGLFRRALEYVDSGQPILITGPAGSGKSALARALHQLSQRASEPFRVVRSHGLDDLPRNAAHDRTSSSRAYWQALRTPGTLVLDEIGDLSRPAQTHLLKSLMTLDSPVNLLALTHMCLPHAVRRGTFRADLLQHLGRQTLTLPSLSARREDLALLAEHFRQELAATNPAVAGFAGCALRALLQHHWPGNVRELRNRIERAMLVAQTEMIRATDLGFPAP